MKKQVYIIADNSFYGGCEIIGEGQEVDFYYTEVRPPDGLYRAKWTGTEWVEDMTQEEIDKLNNQPRELTEIEKLKISQAEQFETILELLGGM